jgi:hypothetical protein
LTLQPVTVDHLYTRINASGRRGRFRWTMAGMTYTMSYTREHPSGAEVAIAAKTLRLSDRIKTVESGFTEPQR